MTTYSRSMMVALATIMVLPEAIMAQIVTRPEVQASGVTFSHVRSCGVEISWTRGDGEWCAVFAKQGSNGTAAAVDGVAYWPDTVFSLGDEIGSNGWFCVYDGTDTNVTVCGLAPDTEYNVMVCEYSGWGGNETYLTSAVTGNPAAKKTMPCWRGWQAVGQAGFSTGEISSISQAFNNGTPYVAFTDDANDFKATVMKFNGSDWEVVGPACFTDGDVMFLTIAFDNQQPYVCFMDGANDYKATVMKFNGSGWEAVGMPGFSAGAAWCASMAFNNGLPYVAYSDEANGYKATVMAFNGVSWEPVGAAGFTPSEAWTTTLAIDNGTPYVGFMDYAADYRATVMKFNGADWEVVGNAGFSAADVADLSLKFDNGQGYVCFVDGAYGYKATVMKFSGNGWIPVGREGFTDGEAGSLCMGFEGGETYVAYSDGVHGYKATVARFNGEYWEPVGSPAFTSGDVRCLSLAFNAAEPYVALAHSGDGYRVSVVTSPRIASSTVLSSTPNPSLSGEQVEFTAVVTCVAGIPGGTVTFRDGTAVLATVDLDFLGHATFATNDLTLGAHIVSATYSGCPCVKGSSGSVTQSVNEAEGAGDFESQIAGVAAAIVADSPSGMTIQFAGTPGYVYDVERTTNLLSGEWTVVLTTNAPANGTWVYVDSNPAEQAYYRTKLH